MDVPGCGNSRILQQLSGVTKERVNCSSGAAGVCLCIVQQDGEDFLPVLLLGTSPLNAVGSIEARDCGGLHSQSVVVASSVESSPQ